MSETNRVQRWREGKRQHGLKAVTVWLTQEEELRLKGLALQWHCSPSAVLQQALAQVSTTPLAQNSIPPDTTLIRELIRAELDARQAEQAPVTDTVTETVTATVTATVTEVVTATLARDLPALVRQLVEGLALEVLSLPATDMFCDVTDTEDDITDTHGDVTDTELPEEALAPRRGGRPLGAMGQRIVALLAEHPEGLSAEEIRAYLKPGRPLGDALQSLRMRARVRTEGKGRDLRYFVA